MMYITYNSPRTIEQANGTTATCYISPSSPRNTLFPSAIIRYSDFLGANRKIFKDLSLYSIREPLIGRNGLDYIKLHIMKSKGYYKSFSPGIVNHLSVAHRNQLSPIQAFKKAHLRLVKSPKKSLSPSPTKASSKDSHVSKCALTPPRKSRCKSRTPSPPPTRTRQSRLRHHTPHHGSHHFLSPS